MRADRRDPVIAEIKKYRALNLVVHMRTGDPRQVPVPTKANKWELLSETLAKLDWVQIECFDREGSLLGIVEGDEDDDAGDDDGSTRDERMARLILQVVQTTQQTTSAQYAQQMQSFVELASATTTGLRALQETYATALRVQAASMAQAGAGDADSDIMKMLQMGMMMQNRAPSTPPTPPAPKLRPRPLPQAPREESKPAAPHTNGVAKAS